MYVCVECICSCSSAKQYNVAGDFTFGPAAGKKRKRETDEELPGKQSQSVYSPVLTSLVM